MLNEILSKATISEIIKPAISKLRKVFTSKGIELIVSNENLQDAIFEHNTFILNITRNISFQEQKGNKILSEVYIDLDIQLQPKRLILDTENTEKFTVFEILKNTSNHIVILGGPGAGKTTTVRNICHTLLLGSDNLKYNFPILINLRDLPESDSIYLKIKSILGIEFFTSNKEENKKQTLLEDKNFLIKYINSYLNSLGVILVLDGLDEVNPKRLSRFNSEIQNLTLGLSESLIIITCRSASYNNYFENTLDYEICDLNRIQIEKFVNNWFEAKDESLTFLKELSSSKFYDFTLKPITLAHLCAIYEKTKKFYDKPKSIYKKLVRILIEEWDEQRGITRESNYANFDNETKFDFLSHFAYDLTTYYIHKRYSEEDLKIHFIE